jgi:hypothetical protein
MSTVGCPAFVDTGSSHSTPTRVVAVVKGAGDTLLEAVVKYSGIRVLSYETTADSSLGSPLTVAVLEVDDIGVLHRWYANGGGIAPFPDGTLLYWRFG